MRVIIIIISKAVLVPVLLIELSLWSGQLPTSQASVSFRVSLCFKQAEYVYTLQLVVYVTHKVALELRCILATG